MEQRLVLGVDNDCAYCAGMAASIEERFGDRLEIQALDNPQVEEWRKQSLGNNTPWTPTLIEKNGDTVKAWTGYGMGVALTRKLGPVETWRLMQLLGEFRRSFGHEVRREDLAAGEPGVEFTRSGFLAMATKSVAGALVASTVLGAMARPAEAASWPRCKRGEFGGPYTDVGVITRSGVAYVHVYNRNALGGIPVHVRLQGWDQSGSAWVPPLSWRRIGRGGVTNNPFSKFAYRCGATSVFVSSWGFRISTSESDGGGLYAIASRRCGRCP